jgi:hypothetical protein
VSIYLEICFEFGGNREVGDSSHSVGVGPALPLAKPAYIGRSRVSAYCGFPLLFITFTHHLQHIAYISKLLQGQATQLFSLAPCVTCCLRLYVTHTGHLARNSPRVFMKRLTYRCSGPDPIARGVHAAALAPAHTYYNLEYALMYKHPSRHPHPSARASKRTSELSSYQHFYSRMTP